MKKYGFNYIKTESYGNFNEVLSHFFINKKGWLGYYWEPSAHINLFQLAQVDLETEHDQEKWELEIAGSSALRVKKPSKNAFPVAKVDTYVGKEIFNNKSCKRR